MAAQYQLVTRRLNWTGHLLRLNHQTPARQSLEEFIKPTLRKQGRPPTSWLKCVWLDLESVLTSLPRDTRSMVEALEVLASDRGRWKEIVRRCIDDDDDQADDDDKWNSPYFQYATCIYLSMYTTKYRLRHVNISFDQFFRIHHTSTDLFLNYIIRSTV